MASCYQPHSKATLSREHIEDYRDRIRNGGQVLVGEADALCDMALASLAVSSRWIPVAERLPEKDGEIIVRWNDETVDHITGERVEVINDFVLQRRADGSGNPVNWSCATDWMPLPPDARDALQTAQEPNKQ